MGEIDRQYLETPICGCRRMRGLAGSAWDAGEPEAGTGADAGHGTGAIYRQPRASRPAPQQRVYPYLLRGASITKANQVWAADVTCLPMARGISLLGGGD